MNGTRKTYYLLNHKQAGPVLSRAFCTDRLSHGLTSKELTLIPLLSRLLFIYMHVMRSAWCHLDSIDGPCYQFLPTYVVWDLYSCYKAVTFQNNNVLLLNWSISVYVYSLGCVVFCLSPSLPSRTYHISPPDYHTPALVHIYSIKSIQGNIDISDQWKRLDSFLP